VKAGGKYFFRDRASEVMAFNYLWQGDFSGLDRQPVEDIFDDENIGPFPDFRSDRWSIQKLPTDADDYTAEEELGAGYFQLDNEIGDHLRILTGARYESSRQETTDSLSDQSYILEEDDLHPAIELTWRFNDALQLRGGWSRTVNRPDLRELAPVVFENPETRYRYVGNPNLTVATLTNYDLRLEWYHGINGTIELAGFYKEIADPIEELTLPAAVRQRTWKNASEATLWGLEVAAQQNLAPLGRWADDFTVRANAAYFESEAIDDSSRGPAVATNRKHPLQGQPEWIVNFQVTHDYLPWDLKNTLAFNMFGKRLSAVGTCSPNLCNPAPGQPDNNDLDEYEQPVPRLDYVLHWGFTLFEQDFALTFKAKNLLDPKHKWERGSFTTDTYSDGRDFTLEIGYAF
jgi:TonB-dependent receptor